MSSQASSSDLSELSTAQFQDLTYEIYPAALAMAPSSFSSPPSSHKSTPPPGATDDATNTRKRTCYAFNHMPDEDPETKYYNWKTGSLEWRCQYCPKKYALNGGTRILKAHLRSTHGINDQSPREITHQKRQLSIEETLNTAEQHPRLRRRLNGPTESLQGDPVEILFVRMLASANLPLRLVESPEFRDFVFYLNKDIDSHLPSHHTTITGWITRQRTTQENYQRQRLHSARSLIHLSIDAGLSPNNKPLIVIFAHYIGEDGQLEKALLAVKEIQGKHTGENMAKYVMDAIDYYGIASKLGYFQMDNAGNNDTLLHSVSAGMCCLQLSCVR
jgi:hypothetical protein